ncbi:hypothetical protein Q1695_013600 [Nippostrongylus brasiliensis]|nr:hypothetical protein Q1695_013600 [Nippostrongylus brasiliensis]
MCDETRVLIDLDTGIAFANQLHQQTTIKDTDTVANAVALVELVNQLHNRKLPKIDGKENPSRIDVPTEKPTLVSILQHGEPTTSSQYKCVETVTVADKGSPKTDENSPSETSVCTKHTPLPQYKYSRSPQGKHNDMKFYPNIICVICREWVCSRSRRLHIGAHFNYRKYHCAQCEFSHSKEIFVRSHARKVHNSNDCVKQKDDPVLENKIETVCNDSIAMTRDVLSGQYNDDIYKSYRSMDAARSKIPNKERRSRTEVLAAVTDSTNRQSVI